MQKQSLDPAYVAGLFDGEGCVSIYKRQSLFVVELVIAMTHEEVIRLLHEHYGGNLTRRQQKDHWKPQYRWKLLAIQDILGFIEEVEPHCVVKREQLAVVKNFCLLRRSLPKTTKISAFEARTFELWKEELSRLNRKGVHA